MTRLGCVTIDEDSDPGAWAEALRFLVCVEHPANCSFAPDGAPLFFIPVAALPHETGDRT